MPNLFSKMTFYWTNDIVLKGAAGKLSEEEMVAPKGGDCVKKDLFRHSYDKRKGEKNRLVKALFDCFGGDFVIAGICKLSWGTFLLLCAFYFVRSLLAYLKKTIKPADEGYGLCIGMFLAAEFMSLSGQQMTSHLSSCSVNAYSALVRSVYRKSLFAANVGKDIGSIVNIVSSDCPKVQLAITQFHILWTGILEVLAIMALLLYLTGVNAILATGLTFLSSFLMIYTGAKLAVLRDGLAIASDIRMNVLNDMSLGIKLVKFYSWERFFLEAVAAARRQEMLKLRMGGFLKSMAIMLVFFIPPILAITIFGLSTRDVEGGILDSVVSFTVLSVFNTLRFPLVVLPKALKIVVEARPAIKRIETFLEMAEVEPPKEGLVDGIYFEKATVGYDTTSPPVLSNVNLSIPPGAKVAIAGPLGSGKSTVFNAIIGEAQVLEGKVSVKGKIAIVTQTAWIQNISFRDNILFGLPFDQAKYDRIVFACALEPDLRILRNGDMEMIQERGANLSGGQRQRLALARALYSDADIYLLDGPLSAVDQHTAAHIMKHAILTYLKTKTVILITSNIHSLSIFNYVGIFENGLDYFGPFQRSLIDRYFPSLAAGFSEEIVTEDDGGHNDAGDNQKQNAAAAATKSAAVETTVVAEKEDEGDPFKALLLWMRAAGIGPSIFSISIFSLAQVSRILSDWWISQWTSNKFKQDGKWYLWIYAVLVAVFGILLVARGLVFFAVHLRAAKRLHHHLVSNVTTAPYGWFLRTPLGSLLSTFSEDIGIVDDIVSDVVHMTLIYTNILLTTVILVSITLPYFAIVFAVLFIFFMIWMKYYLSASKLLKVFASKTGPAVVDTVSESLVGIMTVRAFVKQEHFITELTRRLNRHVKAKYTLDHVQLWLSFRLDHVGVICVLGACLMAVGLRDEITPSTAGLAVSNALQMLVYFTWIVKGLSESMSMLSSFERVSQFSSGYANEDLGGPDDSKIVVWTDPIVVEFREATMSYFPELPPSLIGVTLRFEPGWKVGIVGRTGSGKSTSILALFRLFDCSSGGIYLNNVNIASLPLRELRSHLAIIPQEPLMFQGTIRTNLDPFSRYSDEECWAALDMSHLKVAVQGMDGGILAPVLAGGANLSLGQKQLLCLARAILNNTKVVCLDEATAAMDMHTDSLVQQALSFAFRGRTVISIAHRLQTIIDSDRIVVMHFGKVLEFDSPQNLLMDKNSSFSSLVEDSGSSKESLLASAGIILNADGQQIRANKEEMASLNERKAANLVEMHMQEQTRQRIASDASLLYKSHSTELHPDNVFLDVAQPQHDSVMPWIDELPALARGRSLGLTPGMARGRSLSITSGIAPNFDHISDISDIGIPIMTKIGSMISGSSTLDAESHSTLPPPEIKSNIGPAYAEYSAYTESLQRQEHVNAGTYITPTLMIDTSFITEQSIDPSLLSQY